MEDTEIKKPNAIATVLKAILYPLMYIVIQVVIAIGYGFKIAFDFFSKYGLEGMENQEEFSNYLIEHLNVNTMIMISIILTFGILLIIMFAKHKSFKEFFSVNKISAKVIPIMILFGLGMNLFFSGILNLLSELPILKETMQNYGEQSIQLMEGNMIFNAIVLALIVPILEEFVFRVLPLNKMVPRISPVIAIILTSIIFGISHGHIVWAIYTFIFGAVLAMIFLKYKSSIANIIIHSVFNFTSVVLAILPIEVESTITTFAVIAAIGAAILAIAIPLYKHINKTLVVN